MKDTSGIFVCKYMYVSVCIYIYLCMDVSIYVIYILITKSLLKLLNHYLADATLAPSTETGVVDRDLLPTFGKNMTGT
jgi:hypothetical protein